MAQKRNFWNGKRVLITGHEGFLGSNLAKRLIELGADVTGVDIVPRRKLSVLSGLRDKIACKRGDVSDLKFIKSVVKSSKPHIIFHLAAEAIVGKAKKNPVRTFCSNVEGTWNVLEAARDNKGIMGVVVASSDKAYGTSRILPYLETTPLSGRHPYDASKSCADIIARSYYHSYDVPVGVIRCGNIYGPGDFNFSRLIPDAVRCAIRGERFTIRSDGKYIRDYVYVDDAVDGYLLLAEKMKRSHLCGEAFNLSNNKPLSVLEIVKEIGKFYGCRLKKPLILNQAQDEIRVQYLSSSKAKRLLGWRAAYSIKDGLAKTVEWYEKNARKF